MSLSTVILAAGKGKRMKSDLPKVLHPLNGRPMIHYVSDVAEAIHSDKIVLIIGHKKELVKEQTAARPIEYVIQEKQLGTGHAVRQTESLFNGYDGDLLVLSGDVPLLRAETIKTLDEVHRRENPIATLLTARLEDATGYGRIVRDNDGFVRKIVEHKDADEETLKIKEINVGIYIFRCRELFETLPQVGNDNTQGEYYLPDVVKIYIDSGKKVAAVASPDPEETHGINNVRQLKYAESILNKRAGE
jgi:UDP-N-acetylglucosamine diphosphorylase/glucosamine-1-phosphate N-acetyltransferase